MKKILVFLLLIEMISSSAQNRPSKVWAKCYGGTLQDISFFDYNSQNASGFHAPKIHFGNSNLMDVHFTMTTMEGLFLTINIIDSNGNYKFNKNINPFVGGFVGNDIVQLPDSNYLIVFPACSFDSTTTRDPKGGSGELYLLKVEKGSGDILWQKNYGGSNPSDGLYCSVIINGNAIYVFGSTNSNDGDALGMKGAQDIWVLKLDLNGNLIKSKCIGGTSFDYCLKAVKAAGNGFIIMGNSESNNGDFNAGHGMRDAVIVKVDSNLNLVWKKQIGGSGEDVGKDIIKTVDGNYILTVKTQSSNGDIPPSIITPGEYKGFLYCFNENGTMIWKSLFSHDKYIEKIIQRADSSFIIFSAFDEPSHTQTQFLWVYFYDKTLTHLNDSLIYSGGTHRVTLEDAIISNEAKMFISGISMIGPDFPDNHGFEDVFIACIKLPIIIPPPPTIPKPPIKLTATIFSKKSARLNWIDSSANEDSFKLYYSYDDSLHYNLKAVIPQNTTSFIDTSVQNNRTVYYKVCASNAAGQSVFSNQIPVFIADDSIEAPTNLTAKVIGNDGVKLNWSDCKDELTYEIFRSVNDSLNFIWYYTKPASDTVLLDTFVSLPHNVNLYYKVRAIYNNSVTSLFSNTVSAIVWKTGIVEANDNKNAINISPTIVNRYLNIENRTEDPVQFIILNSTGQSLQSNTFLENKITQLDLRNYSPGIYFIIFTNNKISQQFKIIKE